MCNPAWNPLWELIGKPAKVRPAEVFGIVSALLAGDPILELLSDQNRVAVLAQWSRLKPIQVALILAGLEKRGVMVDGQVVLPLGDADDASLRHRDDSDAAVTQSGDGRDAVLAERLIRRRAKTAARMRALRARRRLAPPVPRDAVAASPASPSLSFFKDKPAVQERKKETRAQAEQTPDGFAELREIWPAKERMADAERAYRRALRQVDAMMLLERARDYLATKEPWRSPRFLVHWLSSEQWRDPVLPLASAPRVVATTAEPAPVRDGWIERLGELKQTGVWRREWGPAWGEVGCQVPMGTGIANSIATWFMRHPERRAAHG